MKKTKVINGALHALSWDGSWVQIEIPKEDEYTIRRKTLRDQFAMAAMQGLMPIYWETQDEYTDAAALVKCQCESAYDYADAMLKAREE